MSVRKRRWLTPKGEERVVWVADYCDQSGKRHQQKFERKKDADAFLYQTKVDVRLGIHTADSETLTVEAAAKLWIADREVAKLERATIAQYRQHINLHIIPMIGNMKLSRLSTPAIVEFRDILRLKGRSEALVRKVLTSTGSLISYSKTSGFFSGANPVREMSRAKRSGSDSGRDKLEVGRDIPAREEIKAIIDHLPTGAAPLLLVAIFCGLRASELRGLRWVDVDMNNSEIHVRQRADRYCKIGPPKSRSGNRKIPIPPGVQNRLKQWKLACPISADDLVFPTNSGAVRHHSNIVREDLNPVLIAAEVINSNGKPKYGLHCLRHFFASWLINRKADGGREMPLKSVQIMMGHSSINITADCYGHLFPRSDDTDELKQAELGLLS